MPRIGVLFVILVWLLAACSSVPVLFDRDLIERAILLQFQQNQEHLASQLKLSQTPDWSVDRVSVDFNEPLTIQDLPAYHLKGTYNLIVDLPTGRKTRKKQPFDLYIQGQKEGKTWRLARYFRSKNESEPTWKTYLIAPENY
ncbi:hypothetical protein AY599_15315 [Leptolyngbya valderiana BDU 20041]|nr:hypothetical protein [Geitlerinema sp. CS-897]OAB61754.1 hypothetical protein AY599_15315 [Leptolyngbya valderiana BDU 20041]PPT07743.1 hypothetical protein CKA32_001020 [Geitlerinema sp. FC II]